MVVKPPQRNLSPDADAWANWVESQLTVMDRTQKVLGSSVSGLQSVSNNALSLAAANKSTAEELFQEVGNSISVAGEAVFWSYDEPTDDVVPANPQAVWFQRDPENDSVVATWEWQPSGLDGEDDPQGSWVKKVWGQGSIGEGAVEWEALASDAKDKVETALSNAMDALDKAFEVEGGVAGALAAVSNLENELVPRVESAQSQAESAASAAASALVSATNAGTTAQTANTAATNAQNTLNNLRVGGRNFLLADPQVLPLSTNSSENYPLTQGVDERGAWISGFQASAPETMYLNTFVTSTWTAGKGTVYSNDLYPIAGPLVQSVEVWCDSTVQVRMGAANAANQNVPANTWTRVYTTALDTTRPSGLFVIGSTLPADTKLYFRDWMIQRGTAPSGWVPPLEWEASRVEAAVSAASGAVTGTVLEYALSSSRTVAPESGWSSSSPTPTGDLPYVWLRSRVTYGSGETVTTSPAVATGPQGPQGADGQGIEIAGSVATYSALPVNLTSADAGKGFLVQANGLLYIWDGSAFPAESQGVEFRGQDGLPGSEGAPGVGVEYVRVYYLKRAAILGTPPAPTTNPPTGGWVATEPAYVEGSTDNVYTSMITVYSDGGFEFGPVNLSAGFEAAKLAYSKALDAQATASDAQTVAANLQTAIEAGTLRASKTDPGVSKGLTWAVLNSAETAIVGLRIANADGTAWMPYQVIAEDVLVVSPNGTIQLKDNTVTAGNIVASEDLSAKVGQFLTLKASSIIGDTAALNQAFINQLVTGNILVAGNAGSDGKVDTIMLANGAITAPKIMASEELSAKVGQFLKVTTTMLEAGSAQITNAMIGNIDAGKITSGTINADRIAASSITGAKLSANAIDGKVITGATIQTTDTENRGVKVTPTGIQAWDSSGTRTVNITGDGTTNTITGGFRTSYAGQPGVILVNNTTAGNLPGIFWSSSGSALGSDAAIYLTDKYEMVIRNRTIGGGQGPIRIYPAAWAQNGFFVGGTVHEPAGGLGYGPSGVRFEGNRLYVSGTGNAHGIWAPDIATSTFAANLGVASSPKGRFYKVTSLRAAKSDIEPVTNRVDPHNVLDLEVSDWYDKTQIREREQALNSDGDTEINTDIPLKRIPGVIAEDVRDVGLAEFCTYDENGDLQGVMYDRIPLLLIPVVRELAERVKELEEKSKR